MTFPFDPSIPDAPHNPSADQPKMLANNVSTFGWTNVDHVQFGQTNAGYHTKIHQPNQIVGGQSAWNPVSGSGVPAAISATKISGVQQTFAMNYTPDAAGATADTQLFTMTGGGGISQLTGNSALSDGWVWAGGLLFQWGTTTNSSTSQHKFSTVLFQDAINRPGGIPFPNNCFMIQATLNVVSTGQMAASTNITIRSFNATQFVWVFNTSSSNGFGDYGSFNWFAIGN